LWQNGGGRVIEVQYAPLRLANILLLLEVNFQDAFNRNECDATLQKQCRRYIKASDLQPDVYRIELVYKQRINEMICRVRYQLFLVSLKKEGST